jgi:DNA invertase Pin-like site-specific DNA recombinase
MKVAKAKGRLRGNQLKLKPNQAKHLLELHDLGTYTEAELAELFGVGRSTVYGPSSESDPNHHNRSGIRTSRESSGQPSALPTCGQETGP